MIYVTNKKLKRIFRYLKRRKCRVKVVYEYNDSNCNHSRRECVGIVADFESKESCYGTFEVKLFFDSGDVFCQTINVDAEFCAIIDGVNDNVCFSERGYAIRWSNSGPYCYFYIKVVN